MCPDHGIADVCPGCEIPLVSGAIFHAIEDAQPYQRVFGLTPGTTLDDCDAIYVGDVVRNGEWRCPRCGANCFVEMPPPHRADREDDRDSLDALVVDLELSIRARNLISRAGAKTVGDLLGLSWSDLRSVTQGEREAEIAEIGRFLARRGLSLKQER